MSMHVHSSRWEKAQEIERDYWRHGDFREKEFRELSAKYSSVFREMEAKYGFDDSTRILDLGCGPTCPSTLFKKGKKYGVDPLVGAYKPKDLSKLRGKITLKEGSGEEIPFKDAFFDVAVCRNALDHMDDIAKVLSEIKRVTRKGGVIALSIYTYSPFIAALKKGSELVPFLRNIEHPHTFTPEGFKALCAAHFKPLEEVVVHEGKSSVDYGKKGMDMTEPLFHKVCSWANRSVFRYGWFLKESLIISER